LQKEKEFGSLKLLFDNKKKDGEKK